MEPFISDEIRLYNPKDISSLPCSRMSPEHCQYLNTNKSRAYESPIDEFQYYLLDDKVQNHLMKLQKSDESEDENTLVIEDLPFDHLSKRYEDMKDEKIHRKINSRFLKHKTGKNQENVPELRPSSTKFQRLSVYNF